MEILVVLCDNDTNWLYKSNDMRPTRSHEVPKLTDWVDKGHIFATVLSVRLFTFRAIGLFYFYISWPLVYLLNVLSLGE